MENFEPFLFPSFGHGPVNVSDIKVDFFFFLFYFIFFRKTNVRYCLRQTFFNFTFKASSYCFFVAITLEIFTPWGVKDQDFNLEFLTRFSL